MEELIHKIIIIALLGAFILSPLFKWGVVEYVQVHGNKFFSKMFSCYFCLSWWVSVVLCVVALALTGNTQYIYIPVLSTPLTRIMI